MIEFNLKHDIYKVLYAKYLHEDKAAEWLEYYKDIKGDIVNPFFVLDAACGSGRLGKSIWKLLDSHDDYVDCHVDFVDVSMQMMDKEPANHYEYYVNDISSHSGTLKKYDLIVCQQAINYFNLDRISETFSSLLKKNGVLIFNTFSKEPSSKPNVKEYIYNERKYVEVAQNISGIVHHIQICEGVPIMHQSKFPYISLEDFKKALSQKFNINIYEEGSSATFCCQKKD